MKNRTLEFYFDDIIEVIDKIQKYTKDMNFSEFSKNDLVIDAVIRNLEVIGEASTQIPDNIREKFWNYLGRE